jgi:hypothetical protein
MVEDFLISSLSLSLPFEHPSPSLVKPSLTLVVTTPYIIHPMEYKSPLQTTFTNKQLTGQSSHTLRPTNVWKKSLPKVIRKIVYKLSIERKGTE